MKGFGNLKSSMTYNRNSLMKPLPVGSVIQTRGYVATFIHLLA